MRKAACISHSIKCRLPETQDQGHLMPAAILVYAALLLGSTSAVASANGDILFYCQTTNGKQVHIQQHDSNVRYRFGKNLAHPELEFTQPKTQVYQRNFTVDDNGYRAHARQMWLHNGNAHYVTTVLYLSKGTVYSLGVYHDGKDVDIPCRWRHAFENITLIDALPELPDDFEVE
ncbi:hypothetical protein [Neisseria elongata]|uniref:hypothetical protein n=1 Tax=Neisseria elongata TaxID=495 RepID=UPI00128DCCB4|nr:hypothetical protein [Neisseria elongata]MBM7065099.1 hypothetical protein [Neisseria elongata]